MGLKEILGHPKAFNYEAKYAINLNIIMKLNHWGLSSTQRLKGPARFLSAPLTPHQIWEEIKILRKLFREKSQRKAKLKRENMWCFTFTWM